MKELTFILIERVGLILIIAFILTRIPGFKSLIYREASSKMTLINILFFGIFGMISSTLGIVMTENGMITHNLIFSVEDNEMIISLSLVAIVIAGLLGGPAVGLGAGLIAGIHLFFLGGIGWLANLLINPLAGLLAGLTGRFFSKERVISPIQALFIGIFPPILQMQLLLIINPEKDEIVDVINIIGLPLVLSNSIGIAIFTALIGIILREQENEAAIATKQALTIAEEALPFLKKESTTEMAEGIANLLYDRLDVAAVSITDDNYVLAHVGLGSDHHEPGYKIITPLSKKALEDKTIKVAYSKKEIECTNDNCPLEAAIIIPINSTQNKISLIKFYFKKVQHMRPVEHVLAKGIGQIISNELNVISHEKIQANILDAELRALQAQINPHFLFNTLNLIATLFRVDPQRARHITIQLANYMRFNLNLVSKSLIILEREYEHLTSYIEIIEARFSKRLKINLDIDSGLSHVLIPPSTIQPLVENAIEHGLNNIVKNGVVSVEIKREFESIRVSVKDNGKGFTEEEINELAKHRGRETNTGGVGLYNVNQRLTSLLGEESQLRFKNLDIGGGEVYFYIPIKQGGKNSNENKSHDSRG